MSQLRHNLSGNSNNWPRDSARNKPVRRVRKRGEPVEVFRRKKAQQSAAETTCTCCQKTVANTTRIRFKVHSVRSACASGKHLQHFHEVTSTILCAMLRGPTTSTKPLNDQSTWPRAPVKIVVGPRVSSKNPSVCRLWGFASFAPGRGDSEESRC